MSETTKNDSDVLSLGGKAVGAAASTGAGSTPATFAGVHLFVRGQEYAHKGGMWCWGDFANEDEPNSSATPDRWYACDGMTHDLLDALAAASAEVERLTMQYDNMKAYADMRDADLAAARAEVENLTRDRDGWERRTKEIGSVVIRAWALLRDWWQYAQLEEREEPFVDALKRALAADAEHDAYALAEIRRWRDECEMRDADLAAVRKENDTWRAIARDAAAVPEYLSEMNPSATKAIVLAMRVALYRALAAQEGA